ncbi:ferredoxin--nitrite reductase [Cyanobacteria bacterium FACHB-DQ100]|uniref:ferredoxin--nitrite reductase n=1 Tax=Leptolyngbya sp. DQ-M1 TaxID=2933920 RepID=UPI001986DCFD|nr:ferredoxin--nitrite reductase [Cyanobacteria bacterium FACHB-DQ100]
MTDTLASAPTQNKFEKLKAEKDGLAVKAELEQFAHLGWEAMDETDRDYRLKWLGVFFRPVTPGKFMLRMRIPNGILTSGQTRVLGEILQRYGDDGNADITTRQNIQLRGIRIEDLPEIFRKFDQAGLTSVQSGMDNVRNITGSPVAGIDADELIDTRGLVRKVQDMITNNGRGNPSFSNLPRKFNIAIAGCRDNSVHAEINDIAFVPAYKEGTLGFNVLVGGFFSAKRCDAAIPLNAWVDPRDVVAVCEAILTVYRDLGLRSNRQKARLMWLIDDLGLDAFREAVENRLGYKFTPAALKDEILWDKRDHIGIHAQKQPGLNYVGLHVPVGRLFAQDLFDLARIAEVYGSGEVRFTVEQNVIIPNVPDSRVSALLREPIVKRFSIEPQNLSRALVSCTGAQFCNFALIETKNRAVALMQELEQELHCPRPVRIHWTGCPNSCGQPQVADIGLMGTKVRKDGRTVEGVDLYMGGKVGKHAELGTCVRKSIPCEDLKPILQEILIEQFGARPWSELPESTRLAQTAWITLDRPATETPNGQSTTEDFEYVLSSPMVVPTPVVTPATVSFVRSGKDVTCTQNDFILDVADQAEVAIDSSCRSGTCGSCKCTLLEGEVSYDGEPDALDERDRAAGKILTCIARPVDRIVLDA